MGTNAGHIILKTGKWILIIVAALIIIPIALLYIPPVQDWITDTVVEKVNEGGTLKVSVGKLRLRFPFNATVKDLSVVNAQSGDTLIGVENALARIDLLPLLGGKISVSEVSLDNALYRQGAPDSAMYMTARIGEFSTANISTRFDFKVIDIPVAELNGADVEINLKDTVTPFTPDTAKNAMVLLAHNLELKNVRYRMRMEHSIDSLGATLPYTHITGVKVDLGKREVTAGLLDVRQLAAAYLTPRYPTPANRELERMRAENDSLSALYPARPWTIKSLRVHLDGDATYATAGARPTPGLDMNYLQVSSLDIDIDSLYNRASAIMAHMRIKAKERCGVELELKGLFAMDSTVIEARDIDLQTGNSKLSLNALAGIAKNRSAADNQLKLKADGYIGMRDIALAMPEVRKTLRDLPSSAKLILKADINGNQKRLSIKDLSASIAGALRLSAQGTVTSPMDFKNIGGRINIDGSVTEGRFTAGIMKTYTPGTTLPSTSIKGDIALTPGLADGALTVRTGDGELAVKGNWKRRIDGYEARLNVDRFPISAYLPSFGIGEVSGIFTANGEGFDLNSRKTRISADADISTIVYRGTELRNIRLTATLDTCLLTSRVASHNESANLDINIIAHTQTPEYRWEIWGDVKHLDLAALHMSDSVMNGTVALRTEGLYNISNGNIDASVDLERLDMIYGSKRVTAPALDAKINSTDALTTGALNTGDLNLHLNALCGLDTLVSRVRLTTDTAMSQINRRHINISTLQKTLPPFNMDLTMGADNAISRYLKQSSGTSLGGVALAIDNDSIIDIRGGITELLSGDIKADEIKLSIHQHGKYLLYNVKMDNAPGTMDDFAHVGLVGYVSDDRLAALLKQSNINDQTGFHLGVNAGMTDSTINLKFVPYSPTIAYKDWSVNHDNFLIYDYKHQHLDANVKLMSDSSAVEIQTEHRTESTPDSTMHHTGMYDSDLIVKLSNIRLSEWLSISPFAPPVKGILGANMRIRREPEGLTGKGMVSLNDFYYGHERVGSFDLDLNVTSDATTRSLRADVGLLVDSVKVITATGSLNDSTARNPFLLDFNMIHFPLRVANPFLPKNVAQLSGMLNGTMDITGKITEPIFNGYLKFDSTAVKLGFTGSTYNFSESKIPVDSNVVKFNDFLISGLNDNALHINGTVDMRKLSDVKPDLTLTARDMQIVNSSRPRGSNLYGKGYVDLDASVKGNMSLLRVDADVTILSGTNVTYVMQDGESALVSSGNNDMVRFVQFSDTASVAKADSLQPTPMSLLLNANLIISEGTTINVDLSANGKNKLSIESNANLTYSQTPESDGRLTGRLNIEKGYVRYTPPLMSEKNFSFEDGSYVSFTGNMLNPRLNIQAVDRMKANVTQDGQNSRLVNFNVLLSLSNTLQNLDVKFDLSTNDDLTIQNELQSMSQEQRANQAMNLLLYNMYTGPGTKGNANLSGNPLFSFLESQLNTWAANNIKGVDISFGIDQYDTDTDGAKGTTTSYSYRVSKSLFNDRFKIVVGGNYSTDADADENFSQNLINDISFEYMLNRSGSMYLKLFRHVGYESILEGEITQTGVGFVLKRKLNSLRDIFNFKPKVNPKPSVADKAVKPKEDENQQDNK